MIKIGKAGSGTYGVVYTAKMKEQPNIELAVKRNIVDITTHFSGSLKELDILNRLCGHPYIVKLLYVSFGNPFVVPNSPVRGNGVFYKDDYLYFVFEHAQRNGHTLIYSNDIHIIYLKIAMFQILLAVEYMHSKGIIHRDIKLSNLLWFIEDGNTAVKLCDFGLSKPYSNQDIQSPRVVTSWYRAPEICARCSDYDYKSDLWSVGCIFYEMVKKIPLLNGYPDDDTKLLSKIIGTTPIVTVQDIIKLNT